ncbi:hypothetical protein EON65_48225 [archaeon]|nr:MAG: hypothetical protein EON65_48225 [archaeon]
MASVASTECPAVASGDREGPLLPPLMTALDTYTVPLVESTSVKKKKIIKSMKPLQIKPAKRSPTGVLLPKEVKVPNSSKEPQTLLILHTPTKPPLILDEDDKDNFSLIHEHQSPSFPSPPHGSIIKSTSFVSRSTPRGGRVYREGSNGDASHPQAPKSADVSYPTLNTMYTLPQCLIILSICADEIQE